MLLSLISSCPLAFFNGSSIRHHIASGHKLFQKLNSKIQDGSICLKLYITKAFHKLNWDFLFNTLTFFKFDDSIISLMKECICTSRGLMLVNKIPQGLFASSCGLRRGEPISLLLYLGRGSHELALTATTID